ncbi:MAG: PilW family protein [Gammaproteobacteria bacterium]
MTAMYRRETLNQTGLSLIELMIAMVVGLVLMAGVLSIFLSSRQSYGINSAVAQIQENGRFALNFVSTDARKAGYMGCATSTTTVSYLNPAADNLPYNFTQAIYGFHFTGTVPGPTENPAPDPTASDWTPNLDAYLTGLILPNTDVLVVRFAERDPIYITTITSTTATSATVNTLGAPDQTALAPGDLFLASNCLSSIVMQATSATSGTTLEYAGGGPAPGNISGDVLPQSFTGAMVVSPTTALFYIGKGADGSPALIEASTDTTQASGFSSQELVSGAENMRVLYGVDLTSSQVPSEYVTADVVDAANEWAQVVSVRIALLLRSNTAAVPLPAAAPIYTLVDSPVTAPQDTRMRQVFIATIGIRNSLP